jgi:hypothetical protein
MIAAKERGFKEPESSTGFGKPGGGFGEPNSF